MTIKFWHRLYVRIWLAVVLAVLIITLVFGWLWRTQADQLRVERLAEAPVREVVVRDGNGQVVGQASARPGRVPGQGLEFQVDMVDGKTLSITLAPRPRNVDRIGRGERPPPILLPGMAPPGQGPPRGASFVLWVMGVMGLAVALGSYPVIRRLTLRLDKLQRGVERLGEGDLRARVDTSGNDEVAFLAQRFNHAADRIEALVQAQKSLLANASHELRSPLARIRMGIELTETAPSAALRQELARNIAELDSLIDEILLASRLDAAVRDPQLDVGAIERLNLVDLVQEECAVFGVALSVTGDGLVQVQAVPRLLRRMVRNLLENAYRYGGDEVSMLIRSVEPSAVEIEVCDRGPGVRADECERIFEPFYRSAHASEGNGGVGLGLALVKSIAQRHGGSVHCSARLGGGACFVVQLPRAHLST